jgi:hypothetical protein
MKVELKTADGRDVMVLVDPEASPIEIADSLEATANAPAQTQGAAKPESVDGLSCGSGC